MTNEIKQSNLRNENWVRQMANLEDQYASVSVGGMATELDMLKLTDDTPAGIFGRFVEFARRKERLSVEEMADRLAIDLSELVALETDPTAKPSSRTVQKLASFVKVPVEPLLELAGLANVKEPWLGPAAIRFAARTETTADLSPQETQAFDELVQAITQASD